jgi:hypothetical protein
LLLLKVVLVLMLLKYSIALLTVVLVLLLLLYSIAVAGSCTGVPVVAV